MALAKTLWWLFAVVVLISACQQPSLESDVADATLAIRGSDEALSRLSVPLTALGFPDFKYIKTVQPDILYNNPTGELIYPTVIKASDHLVNPLGRFYMYYAPHDAPGGINLAYSDNIEGPYTDYSGNPIIPKVFEGISVSHVSSPHVIWAPQYNKYLMYYHGNNDTNRWAYSVDGVHWEYGGVALTASQFGSGYTEVQYARVYEYTIPGLNNRYIMLHMLLIGTGNGRKIGLSVSNDGKIFTPYDPNLVLPGAIGATNLSGPAFYVKDGRYYVLFHANTGNMHAVEVGRDFNLENHLGVLYDSMSLAPENNRVAAPYIISEGSSTYMFYEAGQRGSTQLALAKDLSSGEYLSFEAESLGTISSGASQSDFSEQLASGGGANKLSSDGVGDYVEYALNLPSHGTWHIIVRAKKHNSRGRFRLFLPQANSYVGGEQDLYAADNAYVDLDLGTYSFNSPGTKYLRFFVTGKNTASGGYSLAIDSIRFYR